MKLLVFSISLSFFFCSALAAAPGFDLVKSSPKFCFPDGGLLGIDPHPELKRTYCVEHFTIDRFPFELETEILETIVKERLLPSTQSYSFVRDTSKRCWDHGDCNHREYGITSFYFDEPSRRLVGKVAALSEEQKQFLLEIELYDEKSLKALLAMKAFL